MTNIFVGNLSYQTNQDELVALFSEFGNVERASIVRDRDSGQSRGFGFVEMGNSAEAANAINALNGRELNGRAMNVNEARPREERGGGAGFGGGRSAGSGGGGRGGSGGGAGGRSRREPRW